MHRPAHNDQPCAGRSRSAWLAVALVLSVLCVGRAEASPLISNVLPCGKTGSAGSLPAGTEMQRLDLDTTVFPDALCNDGTRGLFYFRPATDPGSANRWVIQLQGGGRCTSGQSCAERWCMRDTAFSMLQMSSAPAPTKIDGKGIMDSRPKNPWRTWNHVFVRYCSSDSWSGVESDVELTAEIDGTHHQFRMHMLGARIVDAVIATLRRDGVSSFDYTINEPSVTMPDLDHAEDVILAGASAGGQGMAHNADRIAESLRANNPACTPQSCPLAIYTLIDSILSPDLEDYDLSTSQLCADDGLCDFEALVLHGFQAHSPRTDESCVAWHQANEPGTVWQCADVTHVIENHVTTPMFIRMGQKDELRSAAHIKPRFALPGLPPIDLGDFAQLVREQMADLANIQSTADEGASIAVVPGVFSPSCEPHEVLRDNPHIFNATIEHDGVNLAMFDVFQNWVNGASPSSVITPRGGVDHCPDATDFTICPTRRPVVGCNGPVLPGKAFLRMEDDPNDAKDKLEWTWPKGTIVDPTDFGDPVNGSLQYRLCVWDEVFDLNEDEFVATPIATAVVPPGGTCQGGQPCWKAVHDGFKYHDPDAQNDGIQSIVLRGNATTPGKAKIDVVGTGEQLQYETAVPFLPLKQDTTVTAQLSNSDGFCWGAEYSTHVQNDDAVFEALGD